MEGGREEKEMVGKSCNFIPIFHRSVLVLIFQVESGTTVNHTVTGCINVGVTGKGGAI